VGIGNWADGSTKQEYVLNPLDLGINTDTAISRKGECLEAKNVSFPNRGGLAKREGVHKFMWADIPVTSVVSGDKITGGIEFLRAGVIYKYLTVGRSLLYMPKNSSTISYTPLTIDDANVEERLDVLTVNEKPSFAKIGGRGFAARCHSNLIAMDDDDAYASGLPKPGTDPVQQSTATTGGYMIDGDYKFAYAFYRTADDFYGELSNPLEVTLSGNTATQTVTIRCQTDPLETGLIHKSNKIHLFRTKAGGTEYFKVAEVACGDITAGYDSNVDVVSSISDGSIIPENIYAESTPPPDGINFIYAKNNRLWLFDDKHCYYSEINDPERFPLLNQIDGIEGVTGVGEIYNYLVIMTKSKTYLLDAAYPERSKPQCISTTVGCDSHWSIQSVNQGGQQLAIWLSSDGIVATDGSSVINLTEDKINNKLVASRTFSDSANAVAWYIPQRKRYIIKIPTSGTDAIYALDFKGNSVAVAEYTWGTIPDVQFNCQWTDANESIMGVSGYCENNTGDDEYTLHLFDVCATYDEVGLPCSDTTVSGGGDILPGTAYEMLFKLRYDSFGVLPATKKISLLYLDWQVMNDLEWFGFDPPGDVIATLSLFTDYVRPNPSDSNTAVSAGNNRDSIWDNGKVVSVVPFDEGKAYGRVFSIMFQETSFSKVNLGQLSLAYALCGWDQKFDFTELGG